MLAGSELLDVYMHRQTIFSKLEAEDSDKRIV